MSLVWPIFKVFSASRKMLGSRAAARHPMRAALQRIRRIGEACRDLAEVHALAQLRECGVGTRSALLHLFGSGLLRHGDENVREVVLVDFFALGCPACAESDWISLSFTMMRLSTSRSRSLATRISPRTSSRKRS